MYCTPVLAQAFSNRGGKSRVPHFNIVVKYLDAPALTSILRALIQESSLCLKSVEVDFAVGNTVPGKTCTLGDITSCDEATYTNASGLAAHSGTHTGKGDRVVASNHPAAPFLHTSR